MAHDVRVRYADRVVNPALIVHHGDVGFVQRSGLHIAIAVPLGLAFAEPDPVDHAVAQEPVGRGTRVRVCTVAEVSPVQLGRYLASDLEVGGLHLVEYRRIVAPQMERKLLFKRSHLTTVVRG